MILRGNARSHRDISTIQYSGPAVEWVCIEWDVVTAAEAYLT